MIAWRRSAGAYELRTVAAGTSAVDAFEETFAAIEGRGGGKLRIPAGEWLIDSNILIPGNIEIEGEGMGATVILDGRTTPAGGEPLGMFTAIDKSNIEVSGITMRRNIANPGGGGGSYQGFRFTGTVGTPAQNINVHHCEFIDILDENVYAQGHLRDVAFHHNRVIDPGDLTFAGGGFNFNVSNGNVRGLSVTDNYIQGGFSSFCILASGDGLIVARNHICNFGPLGGGDLINITAARGMVCSDNVIENGDTSTSGVRVIHIGFGSSTPNEILSGVVSGNIVRKHLIGRVSTAACISIDRVNGPVRVIGNVIEDCHPTVDPAGDPALTPSAIMVSSDNTVVDRCFIEGNMLDFVSGLDIYGVRVASNVPASNGVHVGPNSFDAAWPAALRHRFDTTPLRSGVWTELPGAFDQTP